MISFEGKLSKECIDYIVKQESKGAFFVGLIMSILFSIPIVVLTFLWDWIAITALPILIAFPFLAAVPLPRKKRESVAPNKVMILEDKIITKGQDFYYEQRSRK